MLDIFTEVLRSMKLLYKQEQHVRKSLNIYATQLAGGLLLNMLKYFEVMLKFFEFNYAKKIVES